MPTKKVPEAEKLRKPGRFTKTVAFMLTADQHAAFVARCEAKSKSPSAMCRSWVVRITGVATP